MGNFDHFAKVAPECCNAPNKTLPSSYTRNADGSITGPSGGRAWDTNLTDSAGNAVYRRESGGGYYVVDGNGRQVTVSSPYTTDVPPVHHVCTNKNCVSTANGGPWTPRFQEVFDNAGLNINSEINKIAVPGHRGPHPAAYHQYVYRELQSATRGVQPGTSQYTARVSSTLDRIKTEAITPGNQVHSWLTGN
ncbi:MAG: AHH domain-containing protein [Rhodobacteraceae bacterium]|nr:AHH domain-containing protein [Paracoccaceae bacterium]